MSCLQEKYFANYDCILLNIFTLNCQFARVFVNISWSKSTFNLWNRVTYKQSEIKATNLRLIKINKAKPCDTVMYCHRMTCFRDIDVMKFTKSPGPQHLDFTEVYLDKLTVKIVLRYVCLCDQTLDWSNHIAWHGRKHLICKFLGCNFLLQSFAHGCLENWG